MRLRGVRNVSFFLFFFFLFGFVVAEDSKR